MDLVEALGVAGTAGLVTAGGAYFLMENFVKLQLDKVLAIHDAELERTTERLKTQLSVQAHGQTIALTRLEAERAEAIKELHALTFRGQDLIKAATREARAEVDASAQVMAIIRAVTELPTFGSAWTRKVTENSIYFEPATCSLLLGYAQLFSELSQEFGQATAWWQQLDEAGQLANIHRLLATLREQQGRIATRADAEGTAVRRRIVEEFRRHLLVGPPTA